MNHTLPTRLFQISLCVIVSLICVSAVLTTSGVPVQAQTTEVIWERAQHSAEIAELRRTYAGQLEEYRTAERVYTVSVGQYKQVQTLLSLEEAVRATRDVMFKRTQVLYTYLTLVKLTLLDTPGISLEQKNTVLAELDTALSELDEYQKRVTESTDRTHILERSQEFRVLGPQLERTGNRGIAHINLGRVQMVQDGAIALLRDIETAKPAADNVLKQGEWERALEETRRRQERVKGDLRKLSDRLATAQGGSGSNQNLSDDLQKSHAELNTIINYLEELLEL